MTKNTKFKNKEFKENKENVKKEESKKEESFIVNLGVVLNNKGEVLIIKRRKPEITKSGKEFVWAFPGGKQEEGESRQERVEKEVFLETGYKVIPIRELHLRIHPDSNIIVVYHYCLVDEKKEPVEIEEKDEVEEVKWVKPEELYQYFTTDIDPEVRKFLKI